MARAWRTACVAAERHGQTPVKHHDLHERLYTPLWGTTIGTIGWRDDPPGCETMDQFVTRTSAALTAVLAAPAPSGDIAVVSHGGLLVALMAQLGVELAPEARRNATPLLFTHDVGSWRAERLS
jgi:broad specificity phosphatase PhoE